MSIFKTGSMKAVYWFSLITMLIIVYFVFFKNSQKFRMFKLGKTTTTTPGETQTTT